MYTGFPGHCAGSGCPLNVTHVPIFQKQVCEVCAPFQVWPVCPEILFQQIPERFVGFARPCPRLLGTDDGTQAHLHVHVFMDGRSAVTVPCPCQIGSHATVTVHTVMTVVDLRAGQEAADFINI